MRVTKKQKETQYIEINKIISDMERKMSVRDKEISKLKDKFKIRIEEIVALEFSGLRYDDISESLMDLSVMYRDRDDEFDTQ